MDTDIDELDFLDNVVKEITVTNKLFTKVMQWRQSSTLCCGKQCFTKFNVDEMKTHCIEYEVYKKRGRNVFISYVLTCYYCSHVNERCSNWRLPCLKMNLCKKAFCFFVGISPSTFQEWMNMCTDHQTIVRGHLLEGRESNRAKRLARVNVINFVLLLADREGLPWPQSKSVGGCVLIFLPAMYSKNNVHALYLEYVQRSEEEESRQKLSVAYSTFWSYLNSDEIKHIRFSKKMKGLCDTCAVYRDKLRNVTDADLNATLLDLNNHLHYAGEMRDTYRDAVARATMSWSAPGAWLLVVFHLTTQ